MGLHFIQHVIRHFRLGKFVVKILNFGISLMSYCKAPSVSMDWNTRHLKHIDYDAYIPRSCAVRYTSVHEIWQLHKALVWRHNGRDVVSNHQPHDCLLSRPCRCRSKKTSKLHVTGLCAWNSPVTGEFPAQMASNAENVSIWWRHHAKRYTAWLMNYEHSLSLGGFCFGWFIYPDRF